MLNGTVVLFNMDSKPRRFTILPAMLNIAQDEAFAAIEWWQSRYLGDHAGPFDVDVPAYDVAVIHANATKKHPTLISVSHHYTGEYIVENCQWDDASLSLRGTLLTKKGLAVTLFGHSPRECTLTAKGRFNGCSGPGGNWQYTVLTTSQQTAFEIPFQKR